MRVYLASWYASRGDMAKRAEELKELGMPVTSRWLQEREKGDAQISDLGEEFLRTTATIDVIDILQANAVVLNVPAPADLKNYNLELSTWARGGRHFEAGFQYATMMFFNSLPAPIRTLGKRYLVLVGHKENVFHYLQGVAPYEPLNAEFPDVIVCKDWETAKSELIRLDQLAYVSA